MLAYILRRMGLILPTLFGIMLINFALVQFVPGGPIEQILAQLERDTSVFVFIAMRWSTMLHRQVVLFTQDTAKQRSSEAEIQPGGVGEFLQRDGEIFAFHSNAVVHNVAPPSCVVHNGHRDQRCPFLSSIDG